MASNPITTEREKSTWYQVVTLDERPDLVLAHQEMGGGAWPEFMLHDPVLNQCWQTLMAYFPGYQFAILEGDDLLAIMNTVPLRFTDDAQALPPRGVDWGVEKAITDRDCGDPPNCLMGIQVVVSQHHRGKHLSRIAVAEMMAAAGRSLIQRVILPVRPNGKHKFPLIPMEHYIAWTDDDGLPYDDWLRVHARLGGLIIGICSESMIIPGTVAEWSSWTGLDFPGTGRYRVPGALTPIDVDTAKDRAVYREPNVWVIHNVGK